MACRPQGCGVFWIPEHGPQFGIIPHIPCWHFQQNGENVLLGHHLARGQYHVIIEICITMTWLNPTRNVQRAQEHLRKLGLGINEVKSMFKDLTRKANWIQSQMKQRSSTQHKKATIFIIGVLKLLYYQKLTC